MEGSTSSALRKMLDADIERQELFTTSGISQFLSKRGLKNLFKFDRDEFDNEFFDFTGTSDSHFAGALQRGVMNALGHHRGQAYRLRYPVELLAKLMPRLKATLAEYGYSFSSLDSDGDPTVANPASLALEELLAGRIKALEESALLAVSKGEIVFDELPFLYKSGMEVIFDDGSGQKQAGVIDYTETRSSWFGGQYLAILVDIVHGVQGELMPGKYLTTIGSYAGLHKVADLPVQPISKEEKAALTERGRLYVEAVTKPTYLSYKGNLTRTAWWSSESFRADGRVMIDVGSFQRIESDQFGQEMRRTGIEGVRDRDDNQTKGAPDYKVEEKDLWKCYPYVFGFSFRAKRWGKMTVEDLSPIAWRDKSFDQLVLPDDEKKMVRALVEHNDGSFSDIIEGKGGGCIFLLHGPPGQGKTLTAETIAELLKRPLYAISVGELGVTPDQLEERLRVILDVATVWNAVILLDEADIYLEARDEHDIMRNAMVGVFLRLLEYHHGVLFLTTNRVKNIDSAFYSRISVALSFGKGDETKREQIWTNLLASAGLNKIDTKRLAKFDINGRQIKNAIRLSQTLAKAEGKEVSNETLEKVIGLMTAFDRERSEAGGA